MSKAKKIAIAVIILIVIIITIIIIYYAVNSSSATVATPNSTTTVTVPTPAPVSTITTAPADGSSSPTSVTIPTPDPTTTVTVPTPAPATTITSTPSLSTPSAPVATVQSSSVTPPVTAVSTPTVCTGATGQYTFLGSAGSVPFSSSGTTFAACQGLQSADGGHIMVQQSDGNLVIYNMKTGVATWGLGIKGGVTNYGSNLPNQLKYQSDSNFVVYDSTGKALWASGTNGKTTANLIMQNDGNLVLYGAANNTSPVWATGTNGQ
jgi:hypothetical protein